MPETDEQTKDIPAAATAGKDTAAEENAVQETEEEVAEQAGEQEPHAPSYAVFMDRLFASFIDCSLLLLVALPLFGLLHEWFPGYMESQARFATLAQQVGPGRAFVESGFLLHWIADGVLQFVSAMIAFTSFWLYKAATPGKMLLKMRVVDAKTLQPIAKWQAVLRFLGYIPSVFCVMLGVFWILWDSRRQAWHDKLARTVVIYTTPKKKKKGFFATFLPIGRLEKDNK